jgi:hypothetical protein
MQYNINSNAMISSTNDTRSQWPAVCRIAWDLHNVNSDRSVLLVDGSLHHSNVWHKSLSKSPLGRNVVYGNSHSFNTYLPRGFSKEKIKYIVLTALSCTQRFEVNEEGTTGKREEIIFFMGSFLGQPMARPYFGISNVNVSTSHPSTVKSSFRISGEAVSMRTKYQILLVDVFDIADEHRLCADPVDILLW